MIGQVLLQFSKFLYVLPYIRFLSLVELERWLAEDSFPRQHRRQHSSIQDTSVQDFSPDPSSWAGSGIQITL